MTMNDHRPILLETGEKRERVCLITLPDEYDLDYHLKESATADAVANYANRGRGEVTWHSISTYPELRGVAEVTRVYIAWRGRVRAWHFANKQRKLTIADLASMNPVLAGRMRVGDLYMWVATRPTILPANEIPPQVRPVPLRYGWLTRTRRPLHRPPLFYDPNALIEYPYDEVVEWL